MAATRKDSEYVTEQVTISSSSVFVTALEELEEQIKRSKSHWSELADSVSVEEAVAEIDNQEAFKALQVHLEWSEFFWGLDEFEELEVGEKFAEGGQAELYHARVKWCNPESNEWDVQNGIEQVLKVFKGTLVRHLQAQWPYGMLQNKAEEVKLFNLGKPMERGCQCQVYCATFLQDGRFAFLIKKEQEDLRSHIDRKMLKRGGDGFGPFSKEVVELMMYDVAQRMYWLHSLNIVHRDLKASNVLYGVDVVGWACYVADYECSVGEVGTRFWRAPEILQACKVRIANKRPELFAKRADAYSYGMTCYEILTRKHPFEGKSSITRDLIIRGQRPYVPTFIEDWMHHLLDWCWQSNPNLRPSFEEILSFIEANSRDEYIQSSQAHRKKASEEETLAPLV